MSEELENSLQETIERHLNERLRAINEQLSRLQSEFNEAFTRLRESSATQSLEATSISVAIAGHLQAAREIGEATPKHAPSSDHVAILKSGVAEIEEQRSQANILSSLMASAARFAERVALFVVKNDRAVGWRLCEAGDPGSFETIPSIVLSLTHQTLVGHAIKSGSTWVGVPGSNFDDNLLTEQLGGEPRRVAAVPLIVRGKVVAVLYADSSSSDSDAVNLDALEMLVRVAGMAVDLLSLAHAHRPSQVSEREAAARAAFAEPEAVSEPSYMPQIEASAPEVVSELAVGKPFTEPSPEAEPEAPVPSEVRSAEPVSEPSYTPQFEASAPEVVSEFAVDQAPEPSPELSPALTTTEPESPPTLTSQPSAPSFASQYAAPLGSARRYGVSEPELPIEVGEEERRLHNDARRFARLLVSEIKLYNEQKVREGLSQNDLYDRLREDIDRSRQMYEKRVAPPVAARHDYFHQELVNTLAEGDPLKLGTSYPGAVVTADSRIV